MDKGFIQFIGVSQTNVHFNLAVEEKTKVKEKSTPRPGSIFRPPAA